MPETTWSRRTIRPSLEKVAGVCVRMGRQTRSYPETGFAEIGNANPLLAPHFHQADALEKGAPLR